MSYFIYRNEQQYGPYTLQDLQSQVAGGTMVAGDQARSAQGGPWTTVGAILAQASPVVAAPSVTAYGGPPAYATPSAYGTTPAYPGAAVPPAANTIPLPPNLHWAIVLLIGFVFSPFIVGWQIYQMIWIRNIDKESKALMYYGIAIGTFFVLFVIGMIVLLNNPNNPNPWGALPIFLGFVCLLVFSIMAVFDVRRSMVAYYNTVEPIGLRLSGVMTFFFNVYYFQHHMSRIATWKLTGYLTPQG